MPTEVRVRAEFRAEIDGHPVAWQRAGRNGGHTFTPPRVRDHERLIAEIVMLLWRKPPLECPLRLTVYFRMLGQRSADVDNLAKTVLDALNGVLYVDDRQVESLCAHRSQGHTAQTAGTLVIASWEE